MSDIKVTIKPARKRGYFLKASRGNNHFFVHSRYEPVREAKSWANQLSIEDDINHLIFLGGGLGYFPEELEKRGYSVSILELLPEFKPPEDSPASRLLQEDKFQFLDPDTSPAKFLKELPSDKLQAALPVIHPGYGQLLGNKVQQLKEECLLLGRDLLRSRQTVRQFFWQWFDNFIANFEQLENCYSLQTLKNSQKDVPAVLVGAGPSLHRSLGWMSKHEENIFIIAVDSALSSLQQGGVEPDIAISIDPQADNAHYLQGVKPAGSLVASWEGRPEFFRWAQKLTKFVTCTSLGLGGEKTVFPFSEWFKKFCEGIIPLQSGGSVTSTALDLAQYLGCDPLGIVGVDHGYPRGRAFPAGSVSEKRSLGRLNRFQTLPTLHYRKILNKQSEDSKRLSCSEGIRDEEILTNDEYRLQNEWFEEAGGKLPAQCYDFRADGLPMQNWQRIGSPAEFFDSNNFSAPRPVAGEEKIKIQKGKLKEATGELRKFLDSSPELEKKIIHNPGQIPEVLRKSFRPFAHYAGMHGETRWELAEEFISRIKPRLKKLQAKLT